MAEAPDLAAELESAGVPMVEDGEENTLHTVDLQTPHNAAPASPILQFSEEAGPPSTNGDDGMDARDHQSPVDGTRIESRPRATSKGTLLKEWGVHQIRVTKQLVSEKFGRGTRTVDPNLDKRIESLRETQRKYARLMHLTAQFHAQFGLVVETQRALAEHFAFMSVRTPELHAEFKFNSEAQKQVARNGETLLAAVNFFVSNTQTVCSKTIEDTLQTVRVYENSRLAYDAYRNDLEELKKQANISEKAAARLPAAMAEFEAHKQVFEQLRHDVDIKLKLLDENKVCDFQTLSTPKLMVSLSLSLSLSPSLPPSLPPSLTPSPLTHTHILSVQGDTQTTSSAVRGICSLLLWQPAGSRLTPAGAQGQTHNRQTESGPTSLAGGATELTRAPQPGPVTDCGACCVGVYRL